MNEGQKKEFINRVKYITKREKNKLEELKSNHSDLKREDFLWHYLLQSFSTMGNSRGWYGLIGNIDNYNQLKFEFLGTVDDANRFEHIRAICWRAKIRMPDQKAEFINNCYNKIKDFGGPRKAKDILLNKEGRNNKIKFLKEFSGIGDKYSRNIMMDVYHEDFRNSIAIDSRITNILKSWNYKFTNYKETELFLLGIADDANINGWELDRLMYNFEIEFKK